MATRTNTPTFFFSPLFNVLFFYNKQRKLQQYSQSNFNQTTRLLVIDHVQFSTSHTELPKRISVGAATAICKHAPRSKHLLDCSLRHTTWHSTNPLLIYVDCVAHRRSLPNLPVNTPQLREKIIREFKMFGSSAEQRNRNWLPNSHVHNWRWKNSVLRHSLRKITNYSRDHFTPKRVKFRKEI